MTVPAKTKSADAVKTLRANERKWGKPLLKAGWTMIPNQLLERQAALGLNPIDVNILLHIMRHWWEADRLPYTSKATIAKCIKVHPRTVQRRIANLEAAGFIKRVPRHHPERGRQSNAYDFKGLIKHLIPMAEQYLAQREQRQKEDKARLTPAGRPRLHVVANADKEKA
jgi:predicted transcriptional regulator